MTICRNKENAQREPVDEIRSDRWKVLFFMKDGRHVRSLDVKATEAEALEEGHVAAYAIRHFDGYMTWQGENGTFRGSEYSHFIPVPWKRP